MAGRLILGKGTQKHGKKEAKSGVLKATRKGPFRHVLNEKIYRSLYFTPITFNHRRQTGERKFAHMCEGRKRECENEVLLTSGGGMSRLIAGKGILCVLKQTSNDPLKGPPSGSDGALMVDENERLEWKN